MQTMGIKEYFNKIGWKQGWEEGWKAMAAVLESKGLSGEERQSLQDNIIRSLKTGDFAEKDIALLYMVSEAYVRRLKRQHLP